jgi:hypothetical protein
MTWILWAPLGAANLHIFEEFVFPGGFTAWYRQYRADASRITTRFLVLINVALLIVCCNVAQWRRLSRSGKDPNEIGQLWDRLGAFRFHPGRLG